MCVHAECSQSCVQQPPPLRRIGAKKGELLDARTGRGEPGEEEKQDEGRDGFAAQGRMPGSAAPCSWAIVFPVLQSRFAAALLLSDAGKLLEAGEETRSEKTADCAGSGETLHEFSSAASRKFPSQRGARRKGRIRLGKKRKTAPEKAADGRVRLGAGNCVRDPL